MNKNNRLVTTFVVSILLTLSSFAVNAQTRDYPDKFKESYVDQCSAGRGEAVRSVCRCIIKKIEGRYSYEEFKKIDEQIQIIEEIPPYIVEQIYVCQTNPNS